MHGIFLNNITGAPHVQSNLHMGPAKGVKFFRIGVQLGQCAADRKYISPDGRHFNTYAKAQEQWRSDKAAGRGRGRGRNSTRGRRGRPTNAARSLTDPGQEDGPEPASLQQLLEWQRRIAASIGTSMSHQAYFRALQRAQRVNLQVRSTKFRL